MGARLAHEKLGQVLDVLAIMDQSMHDDIENTSVGTDHVITVIYQSIALQTRTRPA